MSKIEIDSIRIGERSYTPCFSISPQLDESKTGEYPITNIRIGDYMTVAPIPYDVLEEYLKDIISNWNQKQKK